MFQDGSIGNISSASLPRSRWTGARPPRCAGLASCRCTAGSQFLHPRMELGRLRARAVWGFPQAKRRHGACVGCNGRNTQANPGPAHLPRTRFPGALSDAGQQAADGAWAPEGAQVISAAATLRPSGSLLAISSPFNSLFKVLFIFPSRYLFAIGLLPIFSFRWNLPPALG